MKAAEVASLAAVFSGCHVKKTEVHGMAQRGGSVESHVRFGTRVQSPLIPKGKADFLVAFHKDEGKRLVDFLKPKGVSIGADALAHGLRVKDQRYFNTYVLGLLSLRLPLREGHWLKALETVFAERDLQENIDIFLKARCAT